MHSSALPTGSPLSTLLVAAWGGKESEMDWRGRNGDGKQEEEGHCKQKGPSGEVPARGLCPFTAGCWELSGYAGSLFLPGWTSHPPGC